MVTLLNKKGLPFCAYNYQKNAQTIPVNFPSYFQVGLNITSKREFNPVMAQIWYVLKYFEQFHLGTIQVLRQQRGGWVGSDNGNFC